jgi:3-methylcrotonyl-CoA carboxylase alpha subunit
VLVALGGRTYAFAAGDAGACGRGAAAGTGKIAAPMPGKVIAVLVVEGDHVEHGQPVVVIEAMKMETTLTADVDGEVAHVGAAPGETVDAGAMLVEITPA